MIIKRISLGFVITFALIAQSIPSSATTLTIMRFAPSVNATLDQGQITLTPPASNSPAKFRVVVADPTVARVDGLVVTLLSVGNTQITYFQDAVPGFTADSRTSRIYIRPGVPKLGVWAERSVPMSANTFTLVPPSSPSNGSWSYSSPDKDVITILGNVATIVDGGEATITATQFATSSWLRATTTTKVTITAPFPVVSTIPNISLSVNGISSFELKNPTSTSTAPWVYTSSNPSIVSVTGNKFVANAPGSVTVTARQGRMGVFRSYTTTFKVDVLAVNPTITNTTFASTTINLTGNSVDFSRLAPQSESPGSWEVTSSDSSIVRINGVSAANLISATALKVGEVTVTARQRASGTFAESAPVVIKVTVRGTPVASKLANIESVAGDPAITLKNPVSPSDGLWSFSSSNPAVATVAGNTLMLTGAGSATITATQTATALWDATSNTFEVRVGGITPTLGAANSLSVDVGEVLDSAGLPTSNSSGKWIFTSENSAIANVVNGAVVGVAVGTTKISLYQEPAGRYGRSNLISFDLTVTPAPVKQEVVVKPALPRVAAGASLSGRTITVIVQNAREADVKVTINKLPAKLGLNTVKPGNRVVVVHHLDRTIYTRTFVVK
jgi:hypothetical protein